jgi:predicted transcriptional regulator
MFEGNFLYMFGFIALALVFVVGLVFLMKKYNINSKQLTDGIDITKTISAVIKITAKELNFASDEMINKIADIVIDSLDYIRTLANVTTKDEKVQAGIKYVEEMCISFEIELSEDRMFIVTTLMQLGINLLESLDVK